MTKKEEKKIYQFTGVEGNNLSHLIAGRSHVINENLLRKIVWILNKKEINFKAQNAKNETPLHWAAKSGSDLMIELMLEIGADAKAVCSDGLNCLHTAFESLNLSVFRRLFEVTPNSSALDRHGRNIAHYAAMCQVNAKVLSEFFDYLATKGISFDIRDNKGKLPLHYLAKHNYRNRPALEFLLKNTANIDAEDNIGQSPIMIFAKNPNTEAILLDKYLDLSHSLDTMDQHGRCLVSNLIQSNANNSSFLNNTFVDTFKEIGFNAHQMCSFRTGYEIDAEGKQIPIYNKISIFDWVYFTHSNELNLTNLLINKGGKADQDNYLNNPTLKIVLMNHNKNSLKQLLECYSSDLNLDFEVGFTLKKGEEIVQRTANCLGYMIYNSTPFDFVKFLIMRKLNPNTRDSNGYNAVTYASMTKNFDYITNIYSVQVEAKLGHKIKADIEVPISFENEVDMSTPLCQVLLHAPTNRAVLEGLLRMNVDINKKTKHLPAYYILKNAQKGYASQMANFVNGYHVANVENKDHGINTKPLWFNFNFDMSTVYSIHDINKEVVASPLFYCVANGISVEFTKKMLERIARYDYYDEETGFSALSLALANGNEDMAIEIINQASAKTDFGSVNEREFNAVDWRTEDQKKIPFNILFQKAGEVEEESEDDEEIEDDLPFEQEEDKMAEEENKEKEKEKLLTYPLIFMYDNNYPHDTIVEAVKLGADINLLEPHSKQNIIMKAILNNDSDLVKDIINAAYHVDPNVVDGNGKTPIHYVVSSHKNGSYENVKLLKFLAKTFDVEKKR